MAQQPKRREIPQAVPAVGYNGPWACSLSDNKITTAVDETGGGLSIHGIQLGSDVFRQSFELTFDASLIDGVPDAGMFCFLESKFYINEIGSPLQYTLGSTRLVVGVNTNRIMYHGIQPKYQTPYNVSNIFYTPLCRVNFTPGTTTIASIEQMQYGTIPLTPMRGNVAYSNKNTLIYFVSNNRPNFQSGILGFKAYDIDIPVSTNQLTVWYSPVVPGLSTSPVQPDGFAVARITTDQNGDLRELWDLTSFVPYNQDDLEDNIITDVHNSLP